MADDLDTATVREHYDRITPVVEALAECDGALTLGKNDHWGWYITRRRSDATEADEYELEGRPSTFRADWDTVCGRINRELFGVTNYVTPESLIDWENATRADTGFDWESTSPMPDYNDIEAVALWSDIDLVDELKPQRGDLDSDQQALVERTLATYAEAFAILYGSREAIFALDSVGGSYIMGAPSATAPIADHFADDPDARERVMQALVKERSNDWLKGSQAFVEANVDGAADVIDPDWVNNKNRAYKAPLSIHGDHAAVVTPFDPFDPTYDMTPVEAVDDALIDEATGWAEALTDDSYRHLAANIVENLWPDYTARHDDWRDALEEWVQDERRQESRPDGTLDDTDSASSATSASSDARITPRIDDVYAAIDGLDPYRVAGKTIVKSWTENASGKKDNSGSGKKAFIPIWGTMGDSGTANYVNDKGVWNDTGANDYGTPVEMALISEENWSRGKIADGKDWARGVAHLRDLGFDIPVWTPDATVVDEEKMPYWALKQAAFALDVCTEDDLVEDDDAEYARFDAETYNAVLEAVAGAGLEHGRDPVEKGSGSGSQSGSGQGSALFEMSMDTALESTHPDVDSGEEIELAPEVERVGTVQVRRDQDDIVATDPSIDGGYSYIPLTWYAVLSGERSPAHPSGSFDDRELWGAWREAKEAGALPMDDPVPYRARLHIAREHDLAPAELIDAALDDPSALPPAVHNRTLQTIESEYGLNPGKDDLDVDAKAEQRAKFLAGDSDSSAESEDANDQDVKRMLATLDELAE